MDKVKIDADIAAKKAKLEELKRQRAAREQQQRQQQAQDDSHAQTQAAAIAVPAHSPAAASHHPKQQSAEDVLSSISSLIALPAAGSSASASPAASAASSPGGSPATRQRRVQLAQSQAQHQDIAPGDAKILYEQATQTEENKRQKQLAAAAAAAAESSPNAAAAAATASTNTSAIWDSMADDERDAILAERDALLTSEVELLRRVRELTAEKERSAAQREADAEAFAHRELSAAEQEKIEGSEEFGRFLDRSSKIMERLLGYEGSQATKGNSASGLLSGALAARFDYMSDYSAADEKDADGRGNGASDQLTHMAVFALEGGAAAAAAASAVNATVRCCRAGRRCVCRGRSRHRRPMPGRPGHRPW